MMTLVYLQQTALENATLVISGAAVLCALLGLGFAWKCLAKNRKQNELIEFLSKQAEEFEESLTKNKESIEAAARRTTEQANRIAWLEARVRQTKIYKEEEVIDDKPVVDSLKSSITERRYRVLKMSSRGQSVEAIAATLGMMPGEVELIINLNQAGAMAVN